MKAFILFIIVTCSGCQLQVNIASNVTNVPIVKTQFESDEANMTGSSLEDVKKGPDKAGDVKVIP